VILGFDTATAATAVALWSPQRALERRDDPPPGTRPAHASRLLALIEETFRDAGASWESIERIAVGVGPGGFTGLRLGIATARALAQARDLPLAGVSSLAALAAAAQNQGGSDPPYRGREAKRPQIAGRGQGGSDPPWVVAVIDARRGEVFAASPGVFEPVAVKPAALARRIGPGWLAVGDGAVRFREELERAGAVVPADGSPLHRVSAIEICKLGATAEPAGRDALLPDYRREPDAKPRRPESFPQ
jgi:tRNA threonylcarbamoyladenosine biosynthesis protein TsaB